MYALFSQQKLVYQGLLGAAQSELMNITHQHENLALRDTGLKSKLSSIQELYGNEKADLYDELANSVSKSDYEILEEGPNGEKGSKNTSHKKTNNGTNTTGTTNNETYTKYEWLCELYNLDPDNPDLDSLKDRLRTTIEDRLTEIDQELAVEEAKINKQIDEVALKETRLDTEKASIETKITDYQKQLEKIEEAEGKGIEASIGKFQGVG